MINKPKKAFIYIMSCRRRALDASRFRTYLTENKYIIVNGPKDADIIVFFTCAFIDKVAESVLNKIKEFQKNYKAELIVAGCAPEIEKEKLSKIFNGRMMFTKNFDKNPDKIDLLFQGNKIKFKDIDDANIPLRISLGKEGIEKIKRSISIKKVIQILPLRNLYFNIKKHILKNLCGLGATDSFPVLSNKSFYLIRVSWGCPSNCSYCITKKAVGTLKSKPINDCINEFKRGLEKGYVHFSIEGDDTGAYGLDINSSFPELLDEITKTPGDYKIVIENLNMRWVVKYIDRLEEIVKMGKIVVLDVAIQSGSSRILKLMRRYSDTKKMKDALLRLKKADPYLSINTHIIIGFPTETWGEFKQTLDLIKEIDLNAGQVYSFSSRKGTDAVVLKPKLSKIEFKKRMKYAKKYLRKIGYRIIWESESYFFLFDKMA